MKILVTGFKDFDHFHNPTQDIARALDGQKLHGVDIVSAVIDVSWTKTWGEILEAVNKHHPIDALVSFGVDQGIEGIHLETTAYNIKGEGSEIRPIVNNGPYRLPTNIPYGYIVRQRHNYHKKTIKILPNFPEANFLTIEPNGNAGDFLCNFAFYNEIYQFCSNDIPVRGFVHIRDVNSEYPMDSLIQSSAFVIDCIAKWITHAPVNKFSEDDLLQIHYPDNF